MRSSQAERRLSACLSVSLSLLLALSRFLHLSVSLTPICFSLSLSLLLSVCLSRSLSLSHTHSLSRYQDLRVAMAAVKQNGAALEFAGTTSLSPNPEQGGTTSLFSEPYQFVVRCQLVLSQQYSSRSQRLRPAFITDCDGLLNLFYRNSIQPAMHDYIGFFLPIFPAFSTGLIHFICKFPEPTTLDPKPQNTEILNHKPFTQTPRARRPRRPRGCALNHQPSTLNPQSSTLSPQH